MTTSIHPTEQRHFSRVPFQIEAQLSGAPGSITVSVADLSLKGALVQRPVQWPQLVHGMALVLEIRLDPAGAASIVMQTEVAHLDPTRMGLRCVHIDLDSVTELRRLVAINLGDAAVLDRELAALG